MIERQQHKDYRHDAEGDGPRHGDVASGLFQKACQDDQQTLSCYGGDTVEGAADAYVERLLVVVEGVHIIAVGCNVVGGRGEGYQPEGRQRELEEERCGQREGDAGKADGDDKLHGDRPPALGLHQIYKGAPEGFDDPGQVEPAGIQGDIGIRDAQAFIHNGRNGHHCHVWQGFGHIECGYPRPRRFLLFHISKPVLFLHLYNNIGGCHRSYSLSRPSRQHQSDIDRHHVPNRDLSG